MNKPHKHIIPYKSGLKEKARKLRKDSTLSEILLWQHLKNRQMLGFDFDRQKPVDSFIVDFFCNELMLAIEVDGDSHEGKESYDLDRQEKLESLGIHILRFDDIEVKTNMVQVLDVIEKWIQQYTTEDPPHPDKSGYPSQEGT